MNELKRIKSLSLEEDPVYGMHVVYSLYAQIPGVDPEEDLQCVYVGVTSDWPTRKATHMKKWWWQTIISVELSRYETREDADEMEKRTILWAEPALNIVTSERLRRKMQRSGAL